MVLSCHQSDPCEHLHPQVPPCYCSDHIDSVLLSLDVVSPDTEDVPLLINVGVVLNPGDMSVESLLKVLLQLVLQLDGAVQLLLKVLHLIGLALLVFILLSLKVSPLSLLIEEIDCQLLLLGLQSKRCPVSECFGFLVLDPVIDGGPQESLLVLELLEVIKPCVESFSLLVVDPSGDEVSHDLMTLALHLREEMLLLAFIVLYLLVEVLDLSVMVNVSSLEFLYVFNVDLLPH
jgi:hypothetical protein